MAGPVGSDRTQLLAPDGSSTGGVVRSSITMQQLAPMATADVLPELAVLAMNIDRLRRDENSNLSFKHPLELFPVPAQLVRTVVSAPAEGLHHRKAFRQRWQLVGCVVINVICFGVTTAFGGSLWLNAYGLIAPDNVIAHFLGVQFTWNTQAYAPIFRGSTAVHLSLPAAFLVLAAFVAAMVRACLCCTHDRRVGFGLCQRRVQADLAAKVMHAIAIVVVAAVCLQQQDTQVPAIVDLQFQELCMLEQIRGRSPSDQSIEGNLAGTCSPFFTVSILQNERSYKGEVPVQRPTHAYEELSNATIASTVRASARCDASECGTGASRSRNRSLQGA